MLAQCAPTYIKDLSLFDTKGQQIGKQLMYIGKLAEFVQ